MRSFADHLRKALAKMRRRGEPRNLRDLLDRIIGCFEVLLGVADLDPEQIFFRVHARLFQEEMPEIVVIIRKIAGDFAHVCLFVRVHLNIPEHVFEIGRSFCRGGNKPHQPERKRFGERVEYLAVVEEFVFGFGHDSLDQVEHTMLAVVGEVSGDRAAKLAVGRIEPYTYRSDGLGRRFGVNNVRRRKY